MTTKILFIVSLLLSSIGCLVTRAGSEEATKECQEDSCGGTMRTVTTAEEDNVYTRTGRYELLDTVPHDARAFTQGLELWNATHMLESAGLYKESNIRLVEIQTGQVVLETKLDDQYFAEGLTRCNFKKEYNKDSNAADQDELIVLSWNEQLAFQIDPESLRIQSSFSYTTSNQQGWGMACDVHNNRLYVTDGSSFLHIWNAQTKQEISRLQVRFRWPPRPTNNGEAPQSRAVPLNYINELELDRTVHNKEVTTTLLANVWYQDALIRIQPETGFITTVYHLNELRPVAVRGEDEDCLNGIAKVDDNVYWVTGKLWPFMYKIRLIEPDDEMASMA